MDPLVTDVVKDIYTTVHATHGDGYDPAEVEVYDPVVAGTPDRLETERANWQVLSTHRDDLVEAVVEYQDEVDATQDAVDAVNTAAQDAAQELPDDLTKDRSLQDSPWLVHEKPDSQYETTVSPSSFFRELGPALVGTEDQDLSTYLSEELGNEALVDDWDETYPDWEEEIQETAEEVGVNAALEDAYAQGEALTHAAAVLFDELEEDLDAGRGLFDRALGR